MNLQQPQYIVAIADCQSITKASRKLFVSQPYLSKVVSDFEREIGKKIFNRHRGGLDLTPTGHKVYFLAQSIISQMEQLSHLEREKPNRTAYVKLAFSVGNLILKDSLLLEYFSATHAASIQVDFQETTIHECIQKVEESISEFAIVVVDDFQRDLLSRMSERRELSLIQLDEGYPYCHFHRSHPLARQEELTLESLLPYPFVQLKMDEYVKYSIEMFKWEHPNLHVNRQITVNHYHTYLNLVKHDLAFMFGNRWQISELEKMDIQSARLCFLRHKVYLLMVKREFSPLSSQAKKFLHLFRNSYGPDRV